MAKIGDRRQSRTVMQAEDMAELIIAQQTKPTRIYQNSSIWSTNP
jgi:hypothetical protein